MNWLWVFIGGGIGSVGRFALSMAFNGVVVLFPWPTLIANVLATIVIGVLYFFGIKSHPGSIWPLLATGFCGGLSTFSAFSLETFQLLRQGSWWLASFNVLISCAACIFILFVLSRMLSSGEL